jgi:hypothetical protein
VSAQATGFKKATKKQAKLRMALVGPSGGGKTYTALAIAAHLGKRVAVIDSERGSASLYSDRFEFDVNELLNKEPAGYVAAIRGAAQAGYDVLIVDSLSHAWQELLDKVDRIAQSGFKGNKWSAWSEGTPEQNALVDALLDFPGHLIVTMRARTEWEIVEDERGKKKPQKIGLAPIQRKGVEYEFTVVLYVSEGGRSVLVDKTRCPALEGKVFKQPGKDIAEILTGWLNDGAPAAQAQPAATPAPAKRPDADELAAEVLALIDKLPDEGKKAAARKALNDAKTLEQALSVKSRVEKTLALAASGPKPAAPPGHADAQPSTAGPAQESRAQDEGTDDVPVEE